jgi:hypothetical protein
MPELLSETAPRYSRPCPCTAIAVQQHRPRRNGREKWFSKAPLLGETSLAGDTTGCFGETNRAYSVPRESMVSWLSVNIKSDATNVYELMQIRSLTVCSIWFIVDYDTLRSGYNSSLCVLISFLTSFFNDHELPGRSIEGLRAQTSSSAFSQLELQGTGTCLVMLRRLLAYIYTSTIYAALA